MNPRTDLLGERTHRALRALSRAGRSSKITLGLKIVDQAMDRFFDAALQGHPVRCGPGCDRCCHQWIADLKACEAARLSARARATMDPQVTIAKLEAQQRAFERALREARGDEEAATRAYFFRNLPCVFLSAEGRCSVWDIRPYACRTYFSFSDPELCAPEHQDDPNHWGFILEPHPDLDAAYAQLDLQLEAPAAQTAMVPMLLRWLRR